ncbi:polysaccharide export protein [Anaeromyxobacter sp. K]|uniref:Polysaccharide export protein n=1 Tax=Anaeromyxobacter dehalogenans (strain ATCC BAA-258 / DSM 21875 / 2CP-1) TaxID=455488 RepID=B8JEM4_ANAD2|nr:MULTISPECIES: polysaccharide biosynthesis/export family protein [Anaeromyxobacter]ACG73963.1 polysaccharide export protein [Anaeromyxobacter sp. K]ACL66170.1 polysaccharide export protein [Anaeromyxobacter dehalogenans 2CP-1]
MARGNVAMTAVLLLSAACAGKSASERAGTRPDAGEYRIGREDVLEVVVWHEPELTRVVPVRPDGRISLPLAGEVEAAGKTPAELQTGLSKALGTYIKDPAVAVLVREINASRVFVLGEVARPGGFPLRGPVSVVQAIALAGGRTPYGGDEVVWLRQKPDGGADRVRLSFDDLVKGEAAGALWLKGGDVLYVP